MIACYSPFNFIYNSELAHLMPDIAKFSQYLLEHSVAYSTFKTYKSGNNQYIKWCNKYNINAMPISELKLMFFSAERSLKVKNTTVFKNLYAIKYMAEVNGQFVDLKQMHNLQRLKTGISKVFGVNRPDLRLPCTYSLLCKLLKAINLSNYSDLVYFTAMVTATFGLLRTGEFCAQNKSVRHRYNDINSTKSLWGSNVSAKFDSDGNVKYYILKLKAAKTDTFRSDIDVIIGKGKPPVCPVYLINKLIMARNILAKENKFYSWEYYKPLFLLPTGILSRTDMSDFFKLKLNKLGYDTKFFKLYSFRIGGATMYAKRGFPSTLIQILGRWRSDAYKTYIRLNKSDIANLSSIMVNTEIIDPRAVFLYQNVAEEDRFCLS